MLHRDCFLKIFWVCFLVLALFPQSLSAGQKQKTNEAGIEFPYPKRDVYVKDWPGAVST